MLFLRDPHAARDWWLYHYSRSITPGRLHRWFNAAYWRGPHAYLDCGLSCHRGGEGGADRRADRRAFA